MLLYSCFREETYEDTPSDDELVLTIHPVKGNPSKKAGHFELWWDDEGTLYGLAIAGYSEVQKEFEKNFHIIQLGGIWKGVTITDEDITQTREELLDALEERW